MMSKWCVWCVYVCGVLRANVVNPRAWIMTPSEPHLTQLLSKVSRQFQAAVTVPPSPSSRSPFQFQLQVAGGNPWVTLDKYKY